MRKIIFFFSSIIYKLLCVLKVKPNRIVMECDYGKGFYDNLLYIYKEIQQRNLPFEIIIPINRGVELDLDLGQNTKVIHTKSLSQLYYLATSRYWITNNHYYHFLKKRKDTTMINTWHALGAFKKFALDSAKTEEDIKRFKDDGKNIDYLLVSSENLKSIYSKALNVPTGKILSLGIPRTDHLINRQYLKATKDRLLSKKGEYEGKKYILYAPTFRDNERQFFKMNLDLYKMKEELGDDYTLLLRLHPIIRNNYSIPEDLRDFVVDTKKYNINDLMLISDILITDYSSVVFEYALLNKPMIFFSYDYKEYTEESREFYFPYEDFVPGPIVYNTEDVIKSIKSNNFSMERIHEFGQRFCDYKDGKSTERFVNFFLKNSSM